MKSLIISFLIMSSFSIHASWLEKDFVFELKSPFLSFSLKKNKNYVYFSEQNTVLGFYSDECTKPYEKKLSAIISDQVNLLMGIEIPETAIPVGIYTLNFKSTPFYSNSIYQPGLARLGSRLSPIVKEVTERCK